MVVSIVGGLIVAGACFALWRHQDQYRRQRQSGQGEELQRFLWWQYHRRTLTTTLIGVLGLLFVATDLSEDRWVDLVALLAVGVILMLLPMLALWDYLATRGYYREHDQGVRRATQDLVSELRQIESRLAQKRGSEAEESPGDSGDVKSEEKGGE